MFEDKQSSTSSALMLLLVYAFLTSFFFLQQNYYGFKNSGDLLKFFVHMDTSLTLMASDLTKDFGIADCSLLSNRHFRETARTGVSSDK